ncbi:MAG: uridine phosphorylase [Acidaminococcaceae bacterium]|nr:uridine phosphorylase [Acidaminococcaceae bacterium]
MGKLANKSEVLYHIGFAPERLRGATYALLPGDPGRVQTLAEALGPAEFIATHREYTSYLADLAGEPILVCSTGMGGPSVAIGVEELARAGITHFIRVGTTGSIQEKINLGDIVINDAAVRLEGTSTHYAPLAYPAVADLRLTNALVAGAQAAGVTYHIGTSISSDTFWPGQERYDSFTGYVPRRFQGSTAEWRALGCTNYEMEAATLFVVARAFGLAAGCVCGVVAKRTDSEKVAPTDTYAQASAAFAATVKEALLLLTKKAGK